MFSQKSKLLMLVLLWGITGCGSPMTVVPVPINTLPSAPMSVPTPTLVVPTQAQNIPTQPSAGLIKVSFDSAIRLIPTTLNPETQSGDIVSQYQAVTANASNEWAGVAMSKENVVGLLVDTLAQDKTITLKYPVHVSIVQKDASVDNLNLIMPMGGGGGEGGDFRMFSQLPLQIGEYDLVPTDPNPATLSPLFPYTFTNVTCSQPGAFDLTFTIPYGVTDTSGSHDFAETYVVSFVCPQSVTLWGISGPGQIQKMNQLTFQNGGYVPQP